MSPYGNDVVWYYCGIYHSILGLRRGIWEIKILIGGPDRRWGGRRRRVAVGMASRRGRPFNSVPDETVISGRSRSLKRVVVGVVGAVVLRG